MSKGKSPSGRNRKGTKKSFTKPKADLDALKKFFCPCSIRKVDDGDARFNTSEHVQVITDQTNMLAH